MSNYYKMVDIILLDDPCLDVIFLIKSKLQKCLHKI